MPIVIGAKIQITGPKNIASITSNIKKALSGIKGTIDIKLNATSIRNIGNFNTLLKNLNSTLKSVKTNAISAAQAIDQFTKAVQMAKTHTRTYADDIRVIMKATGNLRKPLQEASGYFKSFGELIGSSTRRFVAWASGASVFIGLLNQMKDGVTSAVRFQREMVRFEQVGGDSARTIRGLEKEIGRLSTSLGVSSENLAKAAVTIRQAGMSARETQKALEVLAKTELAPTFDGIEKTSEGVIAIMAQFKVKAQDLEKTFSSLNAVSAAYAIESSDIIEAVKRAGGAFKTSGGSLNEFLSLLTTVRATTRLSAETIATGFNTIFARLQDPKIIKQLRAYRVELLDKGQFVGPYEAIKRISQALNGLQTSDQRYAGIAKLIGQTRQLKTLIPLLQEATLREDALATAMGHQDDLSRDAASAQKAWIVQLTKLKEEFLDLFRVLSRNQSLNAFISLAVQGAIAAVKFAKALEPLIPIFGLFLGVQGAMQVGKMFGKFGGGSFLGGVTKGLTARTRFASGGVVPGSGSGDTVPAMLTPGEFVVNKGAAARLGYGRLGAANRFASGGRVGNLSTLQNLLDNLGLPINAGSYLKKAHIFRRGTDSAEGRFFPGLERIAAVNDPAVILHEFAHGLDWRLGRGDFYSNSKNPYNKHRKIAKLYQGLKTINPYENSIIGGGGLSSYFDWEHNRESFADAFAAYGINKGMKKGFLGYKKSYPLVHAASKDRNFLAIESIFDELVPKYPRKPRPDFGVPFNLVKDIRSDAGITLLDFLDRSRGYASGGHVPGKGSGDIIPAMLTPGEFVINKGAAQRLGYANLNRMNKLAGGGSTTGLESLQELLDRLGIDTKASGFVNDVKFYNDTLKGSSRQSFSIQQLAGFRKMLAQLKASHNGLFSPSSGTIYSRQGMPATVLHEFGHAIDYKAALGSAFKYASSGGGPFGSIAQSYMGLPGVGSQNLFGGAGLWDYDEKHRAREAFANAFASTHIARGIQSGQFSAKSFPQIAAMLSSGNPAFASMMQQVVGLGPELKTLGVGSSKFGGSPSRLDKLFAYITSHNMQMGGNILPLTPKSSPMNFNQSQLPLGLNSYMSVPGTKLTSHFNDATIRQSIIDNIAKQLQEHNPNLDKATARGAAEKSLRDNGSFLVHRKTGEVVGLEGVQLKINKRIISEGSRVAKVYEDLVKAYQQQIQQSRPNRSAAENLAKAQRMAANDLTKHGGAGTRMDRKFVFGGISKGRIRLNALMSPNSLGMLSMFAPGTIQSVFGTAGNPGIAGRTGAGIGQFAGGVIAGAGTGAMLGSSFGPIGTAVGALAGAALGAAGALHNFNKELEDVHFDELNKKLEEGLIGFDAKTGKFSGAGGIAFEGTIKELHQKTLEYGNMGYMDIPKLGASAFLPGVFGSPQEFMQGRRKEFREKFAPELEQVMAAFKELSEQHPTENFRQLSKRSPKLAEGLKILGIFDPNKLEALKKVSDARARQNKKQQDADTALSKLITSFHELNTVVEMTSKDFEKRSSYAGVGAGAYFEGKLGAGTTSIGVQHLGTAGQAFNAFAKPGGQLDLMKKAIEVELNNKKTNEGNIGDVVNNLGGNKLFNSIFGQAILKQIDANLTPQELDKFRHGDTHVTGRIMGNIGEAAQSQFEKLTNDLQKLTESMHGTILGNLSRGNALNAEMGGFAQQNISTKRSLAMLQIGRQPLPLLEGGRIISPGEELARAGVHFAGQSFLASQSALGVGAGQARSAGGILGMMKAAQARLSQYQAMQAANPTSREAAEGIAGATNQINNFRQALKNLASSTVELEAAQQKLNVALEEEASDKDARKSVGEIFAFGSMEDKMKFMQGEMLSRAAIGQNSLMGFTDQQRQMIGEHLQRFGGANIGGGTYGNARDLFINQFTPMAHPDVARKVNQAMAGVNKQQGLMNEAAAAYGANGKENLMQIIANDAQIFDDTIKKLNMSMEQLVATISGKPAQAKARGGLVYAARGMMVPRGSDTVPAMLTPGEFVVNRKAAQSNLPLLRGLNNGYYDGGGLVGESLGERERRVLSYDMNAERRKIFAGVALKAEMDKKIDASMKVPSSQTISERQHEIDKRVARRKRLGLPAYVPLSQRAAPSVNAFSGETDFDNLGELYTNRLNTRFNNKRRQAAAQAIANQGRGRLGNISNGSTNVGGGFMSVGVGGPTGVHQTMQQQNESMSNFINGSKQLIEALNSFPRELTIKRDGTVQVILNGAEVISKMKGDLEKEVWEKIISTIQEEVPKAVRKMPA